VDIYILIPGDAISVHLTCLISLGIIFKNTFKWVNRKKKKKRNILVSFVAGIYNLCTWCDAGIHGKKPTGNECHVEICGAGNHVIISKCRDMCVC